MATITVNIKDFDDNAVVVDAGSSIGIFNVSGDSTFTVNVEQYSLFKIKMVKAGFTTYEKWVRIYNNNIADFTVYLRDLGTPFTIKSFINVVPTNRAWSVHIYNGVANEVTSKSYNVRYKVKSPFASEYRTLQVMREYDGSTVQDSGFRFDVPVQVTIKKKTFKSRAADSYSFKMSVSDETDDSNEYDSNIALRQMPPPPEAVVQILTPTITFESTDDCNSIDFCVKDNTDYNSFEVPGYTLQDFTNGKRLLTIMKPDGTIMTPVNLAVPDTVNNGDFEYCFSVPYQSGTWRFALTSVPDLRPGIDYQEGDCGWFTMFVSEILDDTIDMLLGKSNHIICFLETGHLYYPPQQGWAVDGDFLSVGEIDYPRINLDLKYYYDEVFNLPTDSPMRKYIGFADQFVNIDCGQDEFTINATAAITCPSLIIQNTTVFSASPKASAESIDRVIIDVKHFLGKNDFTKEITSTFNTATVNFCGIDGLYSVKVIFLFKPVNDITYDIDDVVSMSGRIFKAKVEITYPTVDGVITIEDLEDADTWEEITLEQVPSKYYKQFQNTLIFCDFLACINCNMEDALCACKKECVDADLLCKNPSFNKAVSTNILLQDTLLDISRLWTNIFQNPQIPQEVLTSLECNIALKDELCCDCAKEKVIQECNVEFTYD